MIDEEKLIEYINNMGDGCNLFRWRSAKKIKEGLHNIIRQQPRIGEWIPCSERLPEENQNVIVCFAHGIVTEMCFYDKKFHGIYDYDEKVIVAWQPLPEPYKPE